MLGGRLRGLLLILNTKTWPAHDLVTVWPCYWAAHGLNVFRKGWLNQTYVGLLRFFAPNAVPLFHFH